MVDNREVFEEIKSLSEARWEEARQNSIIWGFQVEHNIKWLPSLSDAEINEFEQIMGLKFPQIYRDYLGCMNGTDMATFNVLGSDPNSQQTYSVGYYSYPRDLEKIRDLIAWIYEDFGVDEEFVRSNNIPHIMPIHGHRFLVIDNCDTNPVLSMMGTDTIFYGYDLISYLCHENSIEPISWTKEIGPYPDVKLWLDYDKEYSK